jgi:lysophospholipase L1-like esterase
VSRKLAAACGLALLAACSDGNDSPADPDPIPDPATPIVYAAVGASDALGIGSSMPCLPLTECANGTGYVQTIARTLRASRTVSVTNLGIPAGVLSPRIQDLGRQYGRTIVGNFIEGAMPFVPRDSNVVTIFAGPNDVNAVGEAFERGAGGSNPAAYFDDQVRQFGVEYRALIAGVRSRAGQPRIVVANLPNFAGIPYASGYSTVRRQGLQTLSVRFTREAINPLVGDGIAVVDLMCDGRSYEAGRYSSDGYHPNDAGYALIAEVMVRAITDATFPAPRDDCPQMRLLP